MDRSLNSYVFMAYFFLAQPSPPTGLKHAFDCIEPRNCTPSGLANGSTLVTCACQFIDLVLTWDDASGMFDVQHYLVNISGIITIANTTSHTERVMPETDYLVLVSIVSKCQQTSSAAAAEESIEGVVRAGKLSILLYIHCVNHCVRDYYILAFCHYLHWLCM